MRFLRKGKVKEVYEVSEDELEFVFTDQISVFDKVIPTLIPYKGETLCRTSAYWFKVVQALGVRTHFLKVIDGNRMWVRRVQVIPEYDRITPSTRNFLIPLEVIARYYVAGSFHDRIQAGKIRPESVGFPRGHAPMYGEPLPRPFVEVTTKLEKVDRELTEDEALKISKLSRVEFDDLVRTVLKIDERLNTEVRKRGLIHVDGKKEFAMDDERRLMLVDTFGTADEDRFWDLEAYETGQQMELSVYVDGKFYPQSEAKVSVFDHGLLYGDGVFEGIRAYNGRVFKLDRHLERLYHSAKAIDLKIPHTKEEMGNIILETCRRNDIREGYIRPVITRGKGDLGLDPRKCKSGPSVVVIAQPGISLYGKVYERGLKVVTSSYRRVPPQSLSPSIKSLNYLNNIMARVEANQYGADEALMLDIHGYVSEATAENFFIVRNSTIVTPWTSTNLPGVTRETVLEIVPQLGLKAEERLFTLYDVWSSDEAFISGTAAEIGPVVELDGRIIGDGKPGPTTKKIMKAFRDLVMTTGTPIETAHVLSQKI